MNLAHVHLMLNHVPVIGTVLGLVLLAAGLARRSFELKRAALWTFVVMALVAIPVYLTGEPAEKVVEQTPGVTETVVDTHEDAAGVALVAVEVLGLAAVAGLVTLGRPMGPAVVLVAFALALVSSLLFAWTANLGGRIHHGEIRGPAPVAAPVDRDD